MTSSLAVTKSGGESVSPSMWYWYSHHHCWPITVTTMSSSEASTSSRANSATRVNTEMTASKIVGTMVQAISRRSLPWIWSGNSSSS